MRTLLLLSFSLALFCASMPVLGSDRAPEPAPEHHLIVISGGLMSCHADSRYFAIFERDTLPAITARIAPAPATYEIIGTCFELGHFTLRELTAQGHPARRFKDWNDWYSYLQARLDAREATRLDLIGFSHGAFLAMATAANLRLSPAQASLTTIDAIDYWGCRAIDVMTLEFLGSRYNPPPGCIQAPLWLANLVPVTALAQWNNFFQQDYRLVHSSVIPQARNWRVYTGLTDINAHLSLPENLVAATFFLIPQ